MKKALLKALLLINFGLILFFWFSGSKGLLLSGNYGQTMIALGRVTGLMAEFLIMLQLILIARIKWIESSFGHDKLARLHKSVGLYTVAAVLLHPIFLIAGYSTMSELSVFSQFLSFINDWEDVSDALIGLIILSVATFLSVRFFRDKLKYERWHFTHLFLYVAIAMAFEHQLKSGDMSSGIPLMYWFGVNYLVFGLMLLYRFVKPIYLFLRHGFKVAKLVTETDGVVSIYIEGKNIEKFKFEPGQFAIINFLQWGLLASHPFSFSQAPNAKYLRFTIKALGDFTGKIKDLKPGTRVIIDGPLGTFTESQNTKDKYLFLGGGVGITPIMSLISSLATRGKDLVLIYGSRNADQITFKSELDYLNIKVFYVLSDSKDVKPPFLSGYIDKNKITSLVPDYKERDFYICGPWPMTEGILKGCLELGIPRDQIHYDIFKF